MKVSKNIYGQSELQGLVYTVRQQSLATNVYTDSAPGGNPNAICPSYLVVSV